MDSVVLQGIKLLLHIPNEVRYKPNHNHYILDTTNSRAIENIIIYFNNTMKGMKSVVFRIWARAYSKKGDTHKLDKIRKILLSIEKKTTTERRYHVVPVSIGYDVFIGSTALGLPLNLYSQSSKRSFSTGRGEIKPEAKVIYLNIDVQKQQILNENKDKAGIYLFTHKETGKEYIGSSFNLRRRFMEYFNPNYLERAKYMFICRAILKHGISSFSLAVLEYCEPEQCIDRENFYLSLFKSKYNTLEKAASSLGYTHTLETRKMMSISHKLLDRSGIKNPSFGVVVSAETRAKLCLAQKDKCQRIEVLDLHTNKTTVYDSIRAAGKALDIQQSRITTYFRQHQSSAYKKRYIFKKID